MALFVREFEDQPAPRELIDMGSLNHSYLQARLAGLLAQNDAYLVVTEVTIDVSQAPFEQLGVDPQKTMKPDVALYAKRPLNRRNDLLKMTEMPLLAIEILSPVQGTQEIIEKFRVYFALGVQSCWLVLPLNGAVEVYSSADSSLLYAHGELEDQQIGIRLALKQILGQLSV